MTQQYILTISYDEEWEGREFRSRISDAILSLVSREHAKITPLDTTILTTLQAELDCTGKAGGDDREFWHCQGKVDGAVEVLKALGVM